MVIVMLFCGASPSTVTAAARAGCDESNKPLTNSPKRHEVTERHCTIAILDQPSGLEAQRGLRTLSYNITRSSPHAQEMVTVLENLFIRTIGIARAEAAITLANMATI